VSSEPRELTVDDVDWVVELAARRRGSTVSVVSQQPDNRSAAEMLESAGYKRTTEFFEGTATS